MTCSLVEYDTLNKDYSKTEMIGGVAPPHFPTNMELWNVPIENDHMSVGLKSLLFLVVYLLAQR